MPATLYEVLQKLNRRTGYLVSEYYQKCPEARTGVLQELLPAEEADCVYLRVRYWFLHCTYEVWSSSPGPREELIKVAAGNLIQEESHGEPKKHTDGLPTLLFVDNPTGMYASRAVSIFSPKFEQRLDANTQDCPYRPLLVVHTAPQLSYEMAPPIRIRTHDADGKARPVALKRTESGVVGCPEAKADYFVAEHGPSVAIYLPGSSTPLVHVGIGNTFAFSGLTWRVGIDEYFMTGIWDLRFTMAAKGLPSPLELAWES